jgi:quercetin 2,3-dioxygenase
MLKIRGSKERGYADHGWLQSHHSFCFADYYDPQHTGFGPLRVINEDRVAPGQGFGTHAHRDMEIISYVLDGALQHRDSMGNGSVLRYGNVQRMSAGAGVNHSEFNHSESEYVHFLQIWIEPDVKGVPPSYEEKMFDRESKTGQLRLIASSDARNGSVLIHQNAAVYASILGNGHNIEHALAAGRRAYLHVVSGYVAANGISLSAGDALKISDESQIEIGKTDHAEILLFDLPY